MAELVLRVLMPQPPGAVTSAGPAVGCHGVALLRTGTLVAARDVEAAEGAEDAGTLRALINICGKNTAKQSKIKQKTK